MTDPIRTAERDWLWRGQNSAQATQTTKTLRPAPADVARAAARCFQGTEGELLFTYLQGLTLNRALGPEASDAALRHLEGQRQLMTHLSHLIDRGRKGPDLPSL